MKLAHDLPFRILLTDPDDLTDWDYEGVGPHGTDDPENDGWTIRPLGGVRFLIISPDGEASYTDGELVD